MMSNIGVVKFYSGGGITKYIWNFFPCFLFLIILSGDIYKQNHQWQIISN